MAAKRRNRERRTHGRGHAAYLLLWLVVVVWLAVAVEGVRQSGAQALLSLLGAVAAALAVLWLQTRRWRAGRRRVSTLHELQALSPPAFERAVAAMLQRRGYRRVERLGGAGDLMADIRAVDPHGRSVVVQCKRYAANRKVTSPEVQAFIGMAQVHHHADGGLYVTTSDFTEPARALARQHGIGLVDGATLTGWMVGSRRPTRISSSTVAIDDRASGSQAPSPGGENAAGAPGPSAPPAVMPDTHQAWDQPRD